jgi:hypothetical protein
MRCFKHSYGALHKALNESSVLNRLLIGSSPDLREDGGASGVPSFARLLAVIADISAEAGERHRKNIDTV